MRELHAARLLTHDDLRRRHAQLAKLGIDVEEPDDAWVVEAELPGANVTPGELDAEPVDAHLGEGVLTIRVPKPARSQPRRMEIKGG